jgi:hypothetical protein
VILYAEIERAKKGVSSKRLTVLSDQTPDKERVIKILEGQACSGINHWYVYKRDLGDYRPYKDLERAFYNNYQKNEKCRNSNISFEEANIVIFDGTVLAHSLAYEDNEYHLPSQTRITWNDGEIRSLGICGFLEQVRKFPKTKKVACKRQ